MHSFNGNRTYSIMMNIEYIVRELSTWHLAHTHTVQTVYSEKKRYSHYSDRVWGYSTDYF